MVRQTSTSGGRMRVLAGLLVAGMVGSAMAQTAAPAAQRVGFASIGMQQLRKDLTYLSSDELAGRMSLQPGDELATEWVAAQFAKAGLKTVLKDANGKGTYLEPFT
ncbi:MAG: peptidase M28, partial [Edaphobacter sp.]